MSVKYDALQESIANCVSPEYEPTEREQGLPWQIRPAPCVELSGDQRRALHRAWMHYGNRGPEHTRAQHKFIQALLEVGKDFRRYYEVSPACLAAVDEVLNIDSTVDHHDQRKH